MKPEGGTRVALPSVRSPGVPMELSLVSSRSSASLKDSCMPITWLKNISSSGNRFGLKLFKPWTETAEVAGLWVTVHEDPGSYPAKNLAAT